MYRDLTDAQLAARIESARAHQAHEALSHLLAERVRRTAELLRGARMTAESIQSRGPQS